MPPSTRTYLDHVMAKNIKQFNKAVCLVTVFVNSSQCLVAGRGIVIVEVVIPTAPVILLLYLFLCHFSPSHLSFQFIGSSHRKFSSHNFVPSHWEVKAMTDKIYVILLLFKQTSP